MQKTAVAHLRWIAVSSTINERLFTKVSELRASSILLPGVVAMRSHCFHPDTLKFIVSNYLAEPISHFSPFALSLFISCTHTPTLTHTHTHTCTHTHTHTRTDRHLTISVAVDVNGKSYWMKEIFFLSLSLIPDGLKLQFFSCKL